MSFYDNLNAICHGNSYFTEQDEVLVYNLYVYNISDNLLSENDLKRYFEHFGEIKSINIYHNGFRDALVCFKNPQGAAIALNQEQHIFDSTKLKIQAADSWLQPNSPYKDFQPSIADNCHGEVSTKAAIKGIIVKSFLYVRNSGSKEELSLLDLNDDCLLHIFSFLNIKDKFKLATLCKRFQEVFETDMRTKRQLTIGLLPGNCKTLTLGELREILLQYGKFIRHMTIISAGTYYSSCDGNMDQRCKFLIRSCPNMEVFEIKDINLRKEIFHKIVASFRHITTLRLHYCGITDETCKLFLSLKELKLLDLTENFEITGRYLSGLKQLHELSLLRCRNVKGKYFIEICKKIPQLKTLNIVRCGYLDVKCFKEMVKHLKALEELMISNNYCEENLKSLAELNNLKLLEISGVPTNGDDFFGLLKGFSNRQKEIREKRMKRRNSNSQTITLEELKIIDLSLNDVNKMEICSLKFLTKLSLPWVEQVDDQLLEDLAKSLPLLTYLNVSYCIAMSKKGILEVLRYANVTIQTIDISGCRQINSSLILNIFTIFLEFERAESCKLCVGGTGIGKDFLRDVQYIKHKDLVKLSFKIWQSDYW